MCFSMDGNRLVTVEGGSEARRGEVRSGEVRLCLRRVKGKGRCGGEGRR